MKQVAGKGILFLAMVLLVLVSAGATLADSQDPPDLSRRGRGNEPQVVGLTVLSGPDGEFAASVGDGPASVDQPGLEGSSVQEAAPPGVNDPISDAELRDLQTVASQKGMSLQATIDRYAWNDNFGLAVASIRESFPEAFAGAEIVDARNAWVAFKGHAPEAAREMIHAFVNSHSGVAVGVRTGVGFAERELEKGIEAVHFAVIERPEVRDAFTSFDFATRKIATIVVLEDTASDSVLDDLQAVAEKNLTEATRADILDSIAISVVCSTRPVIGGAESSSEHRGGEELTSCTSGFGTKTSSGDRGISTAGHCSNSQTDDGSSLTYKAEHIGTHGDFQWHTGPQNESNDFYSGSDSSTEVYKRDVYSVGSPTVGQTLCRNGKTSHKDCQEVRKLSVCNGSACNLVQMGMHLSAGGDSGGPVFWGNTAYGIHQGYVYDPFWPYDREVFARADRIDNALGIYIATD